MRNEENNGKNEEIVVNEGGILKSKKEETEKTKGNIRNIIIIGRQRRSKGKA